MRTLITSDAESSASVLNQPGRGRWSLSLIVSAAIHVVALLVLCWRVAPIFVKPMLLARGSGGDSTPASSTLYFPKEAPAAAPTQPSILSFPASARKQPEKSKLRKRVNALDNDKQANSAEAGSRFGSAFDGPTEGDEIKQGFAVSFTPPHVSRWELPRGVEGDVVVELTIDTEGNVVAERLLHGLGDGIDDKVIATVRDWHFRPATRNGVAIPFKYDARFHFPS